MKIFKAEVLTWSLVRVRVVTEGGNQSFMLSKRLCSEGGICATAKAVFKFQWNAGVMNLSDLELLYL